MLSQDLRRSFLKYFKDRHHAVIASSPVVPHDDPTLLFINAGMNQFKDVFLGKSERDYKRAATAQKCIRVGGKHNDLDNVGHTSRHLTFFEMLGNFSFGDYFKEKAMEYAYEVATQVYEFPKDKIWITVFEKDDEAFNLWQKWMPKERIVRFGEKDNFWAMGDTGPCGPCSELYYDRGPKYGSATTPQDDVTGERFIEFWNLVFMQFNRDASGVFSPLPKQSIDTGSGLERVVALKMGVDNVFGTDILRSLIAEVENISGKKYHLQDPHAAAFHVIADHLRSLSFAIADGAQPSNVDRGYVLRKLLRRAVRYGRGIGLQEPFLAKVLPRLVNVMGEDYPELRSAEHRIAEIITLEEEAFLRTLRRGGNILGDVIQKALDSPLKEISGEESFKLKDTYGFPLEEIMLIAKDTGLTVNLEAYQLLEEQAKEKSRAAHVSHIQTVEETVYKHYAETHPPCEFSGYDTLESEGTVTALYVNGKSVSSIKQGEEGVIILNTTPFYAEKGGQVGDQGKLYHKGAEFSVRDCLNPYPGVIVHVGRCEHGVLQLGEPVIASVNAERRGQIAKHHTATHLLHWALAQILGGHIRQAGSLVEQDHLRFDFNHHKPLSNEELRQVEKLVNEKIRTGQPVASYETSYEEVQKKGDIKQFFGDKYGARVRVVDIDFSKELCGGTHVTNVGTIGLFRITKESSIAAGVRRIEAAVGADAEAFMYANEDYANQAAALLKTPLNKLGEKIQVLQEESKQLGQQLKSYKKHAIASMALDLVKHFGNAGSVPLLTAIVDQDAEGMQMLTDELFKKTPSAVIILAAKSADRCQIFVRVSSDLVQRGVHAGQLIKEIGPLVGGSGGGKADSAQAGGKEPSGIDKAFNHAHNFLSGITVKTNP